MGTHTKGRLIMDEITIPDDKMEELNRLGNEALQAFSEAWESYKTYGTSPFVGRELKRSRANLNIMKQLVADADRTPNA